MCVFVSRERKLESELLYHLVFPAIFFLFFFVSFFLSFFWFGLVLGFFVFVYQNDKRQGELCYPIVFPGHSISVWNQYDQFLLVFPSINICKIVFLCLQSLN